MKELTKVIGVTQKSENWEMSQNGGDYTHKAVYEKRGTTPTVASFDNPRGLLYHWVKYHTTSSDMPFRICCGIYGEDCNCSDELEFLTLSEQEVIDLLKENSVEVYGIYVEKTYKNF